MRARRFMVWLMAGALGLAAGATSAAETRQSARFALTIAGFSLGEVSFEATEAGARYGIRARAEGRGVGRLAGRGYFEAETEGRLRGERLAPAGYAERTRFGDRAHETELRWQGAAPDIIATTREPEPHDIGPEGQAGTLDPLTALWLLARDAPAEALCRQEAAVWNGRSRSRFDLSPPEPDPEDPARLVCAGTYHREAGFPPERLRGGRTTPFRIVYVAMGDGLWRAERAEMATRYGTARLIRQ